MAQDMAKKNMAEKSHSKSTTAKNKAGKLSTTADRAGATEAGKKNTKSGMDWKM